MGPYRRPRRPLEGVENMTFAQISALPEWLKRKAIQRLNGNQDADDDLPEMAEPAWRVTPNIAIKDERPIGDDFVKGIENG